MTRRYNLIRRFHSLSIRRKLVVIGEEVANPRLIQQLVADDLRVT